MMRLNKYVAHAGICSRRKAAELVKKGDVTVNGKIETLSQQEGGMTGVTTGFKELDKITNG